jgi:hypothetical protein
MKTKQSTIPSRFRMRRTVIADMETSTVHFEAGRIYRLDDDRYQLLDVYLPEWIEEGWATPFPRSKVA